MRLASEMSLLFATDFSENCFRSIPAVAHWMDDLGCRLTLLHAYDPLRTTHDAAARLLRSFFAEAEHYGYCQRLAVPASAPEVAIREHCDRYAHDLLVVPGNDHAGLPRLGRSLRARLQQRVPLPLWTLGQADARRHAPGRPRQVACWVSDVYGANAHLAAAASVAGRLGSALQVLYVLPEVSEGLLSAGISHRVGPLGEAVALARLQELTAPLATAVEFHIGRGNPKRELRRLLSDHDTHLLFAGAGQVLSGGLFGPRLRAVMRGCPCPVVCMDGASRQLDGWPRLERSVAWRSEAAVGSRDREARNDPATVSRR